MNMKVTPQANTAKARAAAGPKNGASGFFGRSADAGRDSGSSFQGRLRQASLSLASGKQAKAGTSAADGTGDSRATARGKKESAGKTERSTHAMNNESSPVKVGNKPEKHKKSALQGNRTLYAAVVVADTVVAKRAAVISTGSGIHEPTGKTRNRQSDAAAQKTGAEAHKYLETKADPTKTAKPLDLPAGETSSAIHAAGDESAKRLGAKVHAVPEMTTTSDSKQKPVDVRPSVPDLPGTPGAGKTAAAEASAEAKQTKPPETQADSWKQAKPSTTAAAKAAASVTATTKEAAVQATPMADPSHHGKVASKTAQDLPKPGRAGAATGTGAGTKATVAGSAASSSGSGADSRSSHGDKGKNRSFVPEDHVGTGKKEAGSSSTTSFGLAGSTRSVKGAGATSNASSSIPASGVTTATNVSATTAGHAGNGAAAMRQPGSAATTAGHDAPVTRAGTGQAAGVDRGISRIQNARLIGGASQAEMRVHMETNELGPVQLRASVVGSRIGATISVERPETQALLASKLGVLHQALNNRNLQVDRIDVVSGSGTNAGGHAGGGTSNGGGRAWQHNAPDSWTGTAQQMPTETAAEEITATSSVNASYRVGGLSVRA